MGTKKVVPGRHIAEGGGFIAELAYFDRVLSDAEIAAFEGRLAWDNGLQADLAAGHPWKAAPPPSA